MMCDEDREYIAVRYGIPDVAPRLLHKSPQKATYLMRDPAGRPVVAKVYSVHTDLARLKNEHRILDAISTLGDTVEKVMSDRYGHTLIDLPSGGFGVVTSHVPGSAIECPAPAIWSRLAGAIGQLHSALRDATEDDSVLASETQSILPDELAREAFVSLRDQGVDCTVLEQRTLEGLASVRLRHQLIHGDLSLGNVLLSGNEVGFIDFEDCGFGASAYDIVGPICVGGVEAFPDAVDVYLRCCLESGALTPDEERALPLLCAVRQLWLLNWELTTEDPALADDRIRYMLNAVASLVAAFRNDVGVTQVLAHAAVC